MVVKIQNLFLNTIDFRFLKDLMLYMDPNIFYCGCLCCFMLKFEGLLGPMVSIFAATAKEFFLTIMCRQSRFSRQRACDSDVSDFLIFTLSLVCGCIVGKDFSEFGRHR